MPEISWAQLLPLSALYLALGIWGFDYARRRSQLLVSVGYLLVEFAIGMRINALAWGGGLPLILLPLAAQAVILLPRLLAAAMCMLVIAGISGNLSWVPEWPHWLRNIAQATAAVVFVVVYVGVAQREREARQRAEALSAEVAQLAAANERNRMAREIHDTLGHYLTVIHVQLEAARAVIGTDTDRGMLAVTRAQALAKDGLDRRPPVREGAARRRERRRRRRADRLARRFGAGRGVQRHVQDLRHAASGQRRGRARASPHDARGAHQRAQARRRRERRDRARVSRRRTGAVARARRWEGRGG